MDRFVLTDAQWNLIVWANPAILVVAVATTGCSLKLCCGSREQAAPGATFRSSSASGTVCSCVTAIGAKPVFSSVFSTPLQMSRTWNMPWSMPRSSRFTVTDRAQKGDAKSGDRQVQGRHDDQNPRSDRCTRQFGPLYLVARTALRNRWR